MRNGRNKNYSKGISRFFRCYLCAFIICGALFLSVSRLNKSVFLKVVTNSVAIADIA